MRRVRGSLPGGLATLALLASGCTGEADGTVGAKPTESAPAAARAESPPPPPAAPPERTIWELGPNRHLAHRLAGGELVVDAGAAGFARYARWGVPARWTPGGRIDGEPVARAGRRAALELPLTAEQAASARSLRLRVHAARRGELAIGLGGAAAVRVALVAGWQDVAVDVAPWRAGDNLVELTARPEQALHLRSAQISTRPAAEPASPPPRAAWDAAAGGFALADGGGLAWYVHLPAGAALVGDVVAPAACTVEVLAVDGDGGVARGVLAGTGARVELAGLADRVVRLELGAAGCPAGALLTGARLTVPAAPAPPFPAGPPPRHVIFWVMDTLRADRIPTFQPGARAETPILDRLAERGAVFRQHYVGGNESQTSHASMWTARYPAAHGVRTAGNDRRYTIPASLPILGRLISDAGLYPIGVTGNGFVGAGGGYTRGFREYRNLMQEKGVKNGLIYGQTMLDDLLPRLDARLAAGERVFAFLGTIDTHSPLIARKPWIDRYDPGPYRGPFQRSTTAAVLGIIPGKMGCHKVPPPREIERMRAIYDSAISYQDALLGELLAFLEARGIADETMLVITSDHGEELFEEQRCGHGATLRESLTWVPLLVHYPPRIAARVVDEGSEGVDVLPTILDALDAPAPAGAHGWSLRPLAAGVGAGWLQPSFASQYEYAFAVRLGRWKARVNRAGQTRVYDLQEDPDERRDLAAARPLERRYLADHLGLHLAFRSRWTKATWGVASNMTERGASEMEAP
jgi:arylsulfatase A-like enzyme